MNNYIEFNIHILHGLLTHDSNPMCKKCCLVFAHSYTIGDNPECSMDLELPLPTNVVPYEDCRWLNLDTKKEQYRKIVK